MSNQDSPLERRRAPRIEVLSRVSGYVAVLDLPVTLVDISLGGFKMQAPVDFPVGTTGTFRLTVSPERKADVRARVVHALRATAGETVIYLVGLEFVDRGDPERDQVIDDIIRSLHG